MLGEWQPHNRPSRGKRVPIGEPVRIYPPIISDELWQSVNRHLVTVRHAKAGVGRKVKIIRTCLVGCASVVFVDRPCVLAKAGNAHLTTIGNVVTTRLRFATINMYLIMPNWNQLYWTTSSESLIKTSQQAAAGWENLPNYINQFSTPDKMRWAGNLMKMKAQNAFANTGNAAINAGKNIAGRVGQFAQTAKPYVNAAGNYIKNFAGRAGTAARGAAQAAEPYVNPALELIPQNAGGVGGIAEKVMTTGASGLMRRLGPYGFAASEIAGPAAAFAGGMSGSAPGIGNRFRSGRDAWNNASSNTITGSLFGAAGAASGAGPGIANRANAVVKNWNQTAPNTPAGQAAQAGGMKYQQSKAGIKTLGGGGTLQDAAQSFRNAGSPTANVTTSPVVAGQQAQQQRVQAGLKPAPAKAPAPAGLKPAPAKAPAPAGPQNPQPTTGVFQSGKLWNPLGQYHGMNIAGAFGNSPLQQVYATPQQRPNAPQVAKSQPVASPMAPSQIPQQRPQAAQTAAQKYPISPLAPSPRNIRRIGA